MESTLTGIYYNVLDRIYLNQKSLHIKIVKECNDKDLLLKEKLESVIASPNNYDIYHHGKTLELIIDDMPSDSRDKKHWFNRYEVDKTR